MSIGAKRKREFSPVALLKDWRQRFKDDNGFAQVNDTPSTPDPVAGRNGVGHAKRSRLRSESPGADDAWEDEAGDDSSLDPTDLRAVAGALSGEHLEALKTMLRARGIDEEAMDMVLRDMIEGTVREFDDDDDDGEEEEQGDAGGNGEGEAQRADATAGSAPMAETAYQGGPGADEAEVAVRARSEGVRAGKRAKRH